MNKKVPIKDTGTVNAGINVDLQSCKKINTTNETNKKQGIKMEQLIQQMKGILGTNFGLYFKTHTFHWNVKHEYRLHPPHKNANIHQIEFDEMQRKNFLPIKNR